MNYDNINYNDEEHRETEPNFVMPQNSISFNPDQIVGISPVKK